MTESGDPAWPDPLPEIRPVNRAESLPEIQMSGDDASKSLICHAWIIA
jgi:hypothetical protein